jgi:HlyD family secretion protein
MILPIIKPLIKQQLNHQKKQWPSQREHILNKSAIYMNRAIVDMDRGTRFMMQRQYTSSNPAISVVRLPVVAGFWIILVLTTIIIIWGAFAPIESAAVAQGAVTLLSNKKTIQHLEGGIIEEIFVKDGDTVKKGSPLIRLSDVASAANRDMLQGQLYVSLASESRLVAQRDKQDHVSFEQDMLDKSQDNAELAKIIEQQTRMFETQNAAQTAKVEALHQRISGSEEQIIGLNAQKESTQAQLELLKDNINSVQQLVTKGYDTKPHLMGLQRNEKELEGNLGQYNSEIAKVQQGITETSMTIISQENEFETINSDGLRDARAQIVEFTEKLRATQDVVDRSLITAPTDGIVNGLKYHTIGGVIDPGTPIVDIIPQDDQLIIEAHVKPADIDIVRAGLDARVMFTAYKARSTPKVPGKVIQVSADKFNSAPGSPPESFYIARVEVDKKFLEKMSGHIELYPGMPADVLIRTGSRSFLNYLFNPITDSMHRAFREE